MTESLKEIIPLIISWYETNKKDLPWRRDADPYAIWISEIMLQQTRIEAVIPYYHRFLCELPDIAALAAVDDDRLMKLWEGLGYYSRARNLKKAASVIVSEYGGALPKRAEKLRTLPGIGEYTAGAIASIAFGEPEPAVDGNVLRVISRITASDKDVSLMTTKREFSHALRAVYPSGREAGMLTEGLMELGEAVCLPNGTPLCDRCPVRGKCRAYQTDTVDRYPVKSGKKARRVEKMTVFLIRNGADGTYGVRKRPKSGLLADMWEFPNVKGHLSEAEAAAEAERMGFAVKEIRQIGSARHIFTHVEWDMIGFAVTVGKSSSRLLFETAENILQDYAVPTAFRAYVEAMKNAEEYK